MKIELDLSVIPTHDLLAELRERSARDGRAHEASLEWGLRDHRVIRAVIAGFGVPASALFSRSRRHRVACARGAAKVLLREIEALTHAETGGIFGLDCSTSIRAVSRHEARMGNDTIYLAGFRRASESLKPTPK